MNNYVFVTDSTCDLPPELVKECDMQYIKLHYLLGDQEFPDINTVSECKAFYDHMRAGQVFRTSQITTEQFITVFREILQSGQDIFFFSFSSSLSSSYEASLLAQKQLKAEFPDRTIVIIDSTKASIGEGVIAYMAAKKWQEGATILELEAYVKDVIPRNELWFTVDDLQYLKRGGRLSSTSAFVGSMLNIKPVLECNSEGKLVPRDKVRGRKKALNMLVDKVAELGTNLKDQIVGISHGDCEDEMLYVKTQIQERFGVERFITNYIGAVIGSHSGPGTIALTFFGEPRIKP